MTKIYRSDEGGHLVRERYQEFLTQWPVENECLRLNTREGETFVVACGPVDAPPVLLLHGSGANSAMWVAEVTQWSREFRVFSVDVIGEPGLSAPSRPRLGSEALVGWLDDVLETLSLPSISLVGISLGGWLALDYAIRRTSRVINLVLLCPSGVGRQRLAFHFKAFPLLFLGKWGRRRAMRMLAGSGQGAGTRADPRWVGLVSLIFKHFRPRPRKVPIFADADLEHLTMPILLIVGGRDVLLNSAESRDRLKRSARDVTVRYLPDAGHLLVNQAEPILEFLRGRRGEA